MICLAKVRAHISAAWVVTAPPPPPHQLRHAHATPRARQQGAWSRPPAAAAHTPGEMVVSENGSVSHKASGQQLKCPHCNKILTTSVGLMYHIRLHTGGYCNAHIVSK